MRGHYSFLTQKEQDVETGLDYDKNEIIAIVDSNQERNNELIRILLRKGVVLDSQRSVEHHFWANTQRNAALLAKELYDRGFLLLAISPVKTEDSSTVWNVEAEVQQTPSSAASPKVTDDLTRLGAQFDSVYDGWGTGFLAGRDDDHF